MYFLVAISLEEFSQLLAIPLTEDLCGDILYVL